MFVGQEGENESDNAGSHEGNWTKNSFIVDVVRLVMCFSTRVPRSPEAPPIVTGFPEKAINIILGSYISQSNGH